MLKGFKSSRQWILFYFCCANAVISFNISALIATIPQMSRSLGLPPGDVANIIAWYMIPYGLCALVYVPLATRFSVKRLMIVSLILYAVANWICLCSDQLAIILIGRFYSGVAAASVLPLALMTLGKIFEKEVRGRVIGMLFSASFFGSILGLIMTEFAPWHWLFIVPGIFGFAAALGFCFCPNEGMKALHDVKVNYIEVFTVGGLRRILLLIFFMSLLFHGVCKWYGVYLDKIYGFNQHTISFIIILTSIAAMIGQTIGGYVTDKAGRKVSSYIGIVVLAFSIMALYWHYSIVVLTIVMCLISVGWTVAHNGISTMLTDFPQAYRCELAGLNSAVRFVSGGVGFWISGSFVQKSFGFSFFVIGIMMFLLTVIVSKIVVKK